MKDNLAYVCGPITGIEDLNKTEFKVAGKTLERLGYEVFIPHEIFENLNTDNYTHSDYMRKCIQVMMKCDIIFTLNDWHNSKGASIEVDLARKLDIPVVPIIIANTYKVKSL